jgi:hypothetical protein
MFQTKVVDKIKTHFPPQIMPFVTMWKNMVEPDRPQMAIGHMRNAYWITKATYTHSDNVILIVFHGENGCRTRVDVTL